VINIIRATENQLKSKPENVAHAVTQYTLNAIRMEGAKMKYLINIMLLFTTLSLISAGCAPQSSQPEATPTLSTATPQITRPATPLPSPTFAIGIDPVIGCANAEYPDWETSPYVLPFPVGETYKVNLGNCSSSYHAAGQNDELAYDFAMNIGTLITASRSGTVIFVEESSKKSEINNLVVVDHGDNTFAEYMHLKQDGALVEVGDFVEQSDEIGLSGVTGLAGYPHLHFIVVQGTWEWPYTGVPVTFSNTAPNPSGLASNTRYTALPYP
jgi:murein DD-endopeptidase MepM/ murein hydrolase activator NlpD